MEATQAAASASEVEPPTVLAAVTLTRGDAVKLEDAEVVCLWPKKDNRNIRFQCSRKNAKALNFFVYIKPIH